MKSVAAMNLTGLLQRKPAVAGILLFSAIIFHAPLIFADLAYPTRDFYLHYSWVGQVAQSLQEGNWYPRWMPLAAEGLGQPVFYYYSPLFHLAAGFLSQVTGTHWTAMKLAVIGANWMTGWVAYLFARRYMSGAWPLLAAGCLQFTPLMAVVFWRTGGWPWYASFPLFILLLCRTVEFTERPVRLDPLISLAAALLAATHVLSAFVALLCLPIVFVVDSHGGAAPFWGRVRGLIAWGASCLLGLGLAAIYLYPALTTLSLISADRWGGGQLDWHSSFAFSAITAFQFGVRWPVFQWIVPLFVLAPAVAAAIALRRASLGDSGERRAIGKLLAVSFLALFFSSEISYPLWRVFRPLQLVQFPSRFLFAATAGGLLASILCLAPLRSRKNTAGRQIALAVPIAASLCAALFITGYLSATALQRVDPGGGIASSRPGVPEYIPATAGPSWGEYRTQGGMSHECEALGLVCESVVNESQRRVWAIEAPGGATVRLPVFAFPAWNLTVDGVAVQDPIDPASGLYRVAVAAGSHQVSLTWTGLPEERTGALISLIAGLAWVGLCIVRFRSSMAAS